MRERWRKYVTEASSMTGDLEGGTGVDEDVDGDVDLGLDLDLDLDLEGEVDLWRV